MTAPPRSLEADLAAIRRHTELLVEHAAAWTDVRAPSLCDGWSRAHVLSHVARNAEAIQRLAQWAVDGEPRADVPRWHAGARRRDRGGRSETGPGLPRRPAPGRRVRRRPRRHGRRTGPPPDRPRRAAGRRRGRDARRADGPAAGPAAAAAARGGLPPRRPRRRVHVRGRRARPGARLPRRRGGPAGGDRSTHPACGWSATRAISGWSATARSPSVGHGPACCSGWPVGTREGSLRRAICRTSPAGPSPARGGSSSTGRDRRAGDACAAGDRDRGQGGVDLELVQDALHVGAHGVG